MTRRNGGFWADFRDFIAKGNVVDLAVAVIVGGAFGKIVESFVADIITPAVLSPALKAANVEDLQGLVIPGTAIKYGSFLATVINFIVIALSIFIVVRAYEKMKKRMEWQQAADEKPAGPDSVAVQQQLADATNRLSQALESRSL